MNEKSIKLGVFGFGCVGQGLHKVLEQTNGIDAEIKKICIKNPDKERILEEGIFTTDPNDILNDPDIDVVVELIDDGKEALEIVKKAFSKKKAVVSANKKMIAENLEELFSLQVRHHVPFLYEAACCASIPIIRNLEEYYDNDLLTSVEGIFNGSTNYILSAIFNKDKSFEAALKTAIDSGFVETDPSLDLTGHDAVFKTCIIILHTFGLFTKPENIFSYGIQHLSQFDIHYANKIGKKIKLISKCAKVNGTIYSYCIPAFIAEDSPLNHVDDEYNGIILESCFSQNQLFIGKGAGAEPTGSAVVSDISALRYNYKYEYKKHNQVKGLQINNHIPVRVYLRFRPYSSIDLTRFSSIVEKFSNAKGSYVIGDIFLDDLNYFKSLDEEKLSIILIEEL